MFHLGELEIKMKHFGLIGLLVVASPAMADFKPSLTLEQGQLLINLMNKEIREACLGNNCLSASKPLGPIIEEILRAAQQPPVPVVVVVPENKPTEVPTNGAKAKKDDSDGKDN